MSLPVNHPLLGAALAALGGGAIALVNARLTGNTARKKPESIGNIFLVRQVLNVGYLVLVYYLSRRWEGSLLPLIIGAALGLTVPSLLLALRLSRKHTPAAEQNDETKGDE